MLIDEQITSSFSSLENLTLFTNSVTACLNNADNVSISPKSLEVSYNTIAHPTIQYPCSLCNSSWSDHWRIHCMV